MVREGSVRAATPNTLAQSTFEAVMDMIVRGELSDGTAVSEREIASTLGVSRTPLREALGRLEGLNYLRRSGRTLLVNGVNFSDALEIMAVRRVLEGEAARVAARRMKRDTIADIRSSILSMEHSDAVDSSRHWDVDEMLHIAIAQASGNRLLLSMVSDLRVRTRIFNKDRIPDRFDPGKAEHLQILDAIEAGDEAAASERMMAHIANARDAILKAAAQA